MGRFFFAAKSNAAFFLDLLSRERVNVFRPKTEGNEVFFSVSGGDVKRVRLLAERNGVPLRAIKDATLGSAVRKNVGRVGLYIGLALAVALIVAYSLFLTRLEISGNDLVPTETIASVVNRYVVFPAKKSDPNLQKIRVEVAKLDGIAHATVYLIGNVLHVDVTEELPKVELFDRSDYTDVTSKYDGIVTRVIAYDGTPLVSPGQEVKAGDVLVSSEMILDEGTDLVYKTKPFGEIYGQVRFTKQVVIPDTKIELLRSGKSKSVSSFFAEKTVSAPFDHYEIERSEGFLYNLFPFKTYTVTFFETVETAVEIDVENDLEGILLSEKERFFSELPEGSEKPVFSYAIKRLDKSTVFSLYYVVEIKLN